MNLSILVTLIAVGVPMLAVVLLMALSPFLLLGLGGFLFYGMPKVPMPKAQKRVIDTPNSDRRAA